MKANEIEEILNTLNVNSRGSIRGKNNAINKIQSLNYKEVDRKLMDIRIFVAKQNVNIPGKTLLQVIDEYIYRVSQL